ncbi:hypothetical protein BDA96_09G062400 [Sorghum bicolor]|uniref:Uncharacterized protein n=1 Tax=Sorghum bicolor TaxID=4558 RepID=A0A921Q7Q6_SORBI|nr:hypothetical protein BDA96_09G062400 [Sorghum bicolor]
MPGKMPANGCVFLARLLLVILLVMLLMIHRCTSANIHNQAPGDPPVQGGTDCCAIGGCCV